MIWNLMEKQSWHLTGHELFSHAEIWPVFNFKLVSDVCSLWLISSCWYSWFPNTWKWSLWQFGQVQPPITTSHLWDQLLPRNPHIKRLLSHLPIMLLRLDQIQYDALWSFRITQLHSMHLPKSCIQAYSRHVSHHFSTHYAVWMNWSVSNFFSILCHLFDMGILISAYSLPLLPETLEWEELTAAALHTGNSCTLRIWIE